MNRATAGVDRLATAVVGAALIGVGAGAVVWERGALPGDRAVIDASAIGSAESATWWPWALGAGGVVLVALGLRWLLAHRPYRRIGKVLLLSEGSSPRAGTLTTDLTVAARCAADSLARRPGVASATGRAVSDRGQRVVEISAVLDDAGAGVADAAASVQHELAAALAGTTVQTRILLRVNRSRRS